MRRANLVGTNRFRHAFATTVRGAARHSWSVRRFAADGVSRERDDPPQAPPNRPPYA